jgi:spore maturation protein CgeB
VSLTIVILGLSITSSWGNGHATTYRGLVKGLAAEGHDVLFLERDVPWYAENRDLPEPPHGRTRLYGSIEELRDLYGEAIREADLVIVGSYVPEGRSVGDLVLLTARGATAFYDIDTPVTLASLARGDCDYLAPEQIPGYHLYLSFTGGPTLSLLEGDYGSPAALPLYCSVDPDFYYPERRNPSWLLGYMGTYSPDRQPGLERLLLEPARRLIGESFAVAGPQYPAEIQWPANVERIEHLPPSEHRAFYNSQRATLNLTRADMVRAGWSPSVRLFEAAACATPVVSDWWPGLDEFFTPGDEILVANTSDEVVAALTAMDDERRLALGERARARVLDHHTAAHRARELSGYAREALDRKAARA